MQAKIAAADVRLSDMTFYADNPDAYQGLAEQTKQDKDQLAQMEEDWLSLELLREELSSG